MFTQDYNSMAPHARSLLSELSEDSRLYRSGQDYQQMLDFLVRLRNFAPLALVYDIKDTEGGPLPHDVAEVFRAIGNMTEHRILRFLELLNRQGIEIQQIEFGDGQAGSISKPGNAMEIIKRIPKTKEKRKPRKSRITSLCSFSMCGLSSSAVICIMVYL